MITSDQKRIRELTQKGLWENKMLHHYLEQNVAEQPCSLAYKDQFNRQDLTGDKPLQLTWKDLDNATNNLAWQLKKRGVTEGDSIIVQLPNVVELAVMYFACSKIGAIISPVPIQYGKHELQKVQSVLKSKYAICLANVNGKKTVDEVTDALQMVDVLCFDKELKIDLIDRKQVCDYACDDANRILSICWTSGTTGTPKGVPRSHNMWAATGRMCVDAAELNKDDILLNPFPFVNMAAIGGFLFPAAMLGCELVFHHPIDVPIFLQQMQDEKITYTLVPPALLNQLAKSETLWNTYDFSTLRAVGSGSAPLSPWMIDVFDNKYLKPVVNYYGSNEGICLFSTKHTNTAPESRATVFSLPKSPGCIETKVWDRETDKFVKHKGEQGELLIRGASVFDGYFHSDNSNVFNEDGFFHTGDLVELCSDDASSYRIVGRCKDIINRGGMKISPAEIDTLLEGFPSLIEAAVCAYPDERLGEKICAFVVLKSGVDIQLEDLNNLLLEKGLAKFKLPERLEVIDALPRNPLGKVQRFALEELINS